MKISENQSYTFCKTLIEGLDISKGDLLFVASDLLRIYIYFKRLGVKFDENILLDVLIDKVGLTGSIVVPVYSWEFCNKGSYDYLWTPSQVGSLGNACLKRSEFRRTHHPIYSFAVYGKHQQKMIDLRNKDGFSSDSPFGYLDANDAKQLCIGVSPDKCFTHTHYVEQSIGVPYRYIKDFSGLYTDINGISAIKTYSMYVRRLDLDVRAKFTEDGNFNFSKIVEKHISQGVSCSIFQIKKAIQYLKFDILNNKSRSICSYKGQDISL